MGFFGKLKDSLTKTRKNFVEKVEAVVTGRTIIDENLYEELEETLIQADVGIDTALELVENLRAEVKKRKIGSPEELPAVLKELIQNALGIEAGGIEISAEQPFVIMVVGVNGVGKTTTIGKLANFYKEQGKSVIMGAADTFRAAAIDQLEIWGNRVGVPVIKHSEGSDPAAVAFDSLQAAKARNADVLIIDTAGRLHTKSNLMDELKKVRRVIGRELPGAPHEVLLVVDATTGQNAISQAKLFKEAVDVTGLALTKLDGTAKGGVVVAVKQSLGIPIKMIGVGEGIDDLRPFSAKEFADALFARSDQTEVQAV
ncbi:signal recognition particle-docking protein FtsY [Desulfotomaculum arcticum]|uniref:Signal recognition particle receptor FtsY n=1 Tax=Desulfotruncus arcticus DSM 17038 TaxID=1121424 RepID=A0A1I2RJN9_9FIRM|nr:signal recognition particle-docking protein FtsY [Desulfotruncus arcticus]SFG39679.1 signal recognition particle-docking protein FtsY [Desulfotomaculum arcticum] [Desulfotruncus arcticus DSM 17038]